MTKFAINEPQNKRVEHSCEWPTPGAYNFLLLQKINRKTARSHLHDFFFFRLAQFFHALDLFIRYLLHFFERAFLFINGNQFIFRCLLDHFIAVAAYIADAGPVLFQFTVQLLHYLQTTLFIHRRHLQTDKLAIILRVIAGVGEAQRLFDLGDR